MDGSVSKIRAVSAKPAPSCCSFATIAASSESAMSRRTPPILLTEKMIRPPVVFSKMSRTSSRVRQQCMKRFSKPNASAPRPSHSRWLWIRDISAQMRRSQLARSGTSTAMIFSMATA